MGTPMKVLVIGAGAWGTALAVSAAQRSVSDQTAGGGWSQRAVTLWARDVVQADAMREQRQNVRYLPGVPLSAAIEIDATPVERLPQLAAQHDLIVLATPVGGLRAQLQRLAAVQQPVAWVCKGFEPSTLAADAHGVGLLPHEICAQVAPRLQAGALSGPSFAQEVAAGQPTALVAASTHSSVCTALQQALHGPNLRVYANDDLVGVELGGAVKNVLAIATGLCDGLQLGLNARAALITRGLAEMTRLGVALGARPETFMGLSGLGDLVLTATGDLSRNRKVGLLLAQGRQLPEVLASLGHVAEGVGTAHTVLQRAQALGIELPITACVVALLNGTVTPAEAVRQLMTRQPAHEPG